MRYALLLLLFFSTLAQAQSPTELYGSLPYIHDVTLSPDGKFMAVQREEAKGPIVVVFDLSSGDEKAALGLTRKAGVFGDMFFVDNDYLAVETIQSTGRGTYFSGTSRELMILDLDGGEAQPLIPPRKLAESQKLINGYQRNMARVHGVGHTSPSVFLTLRENNSPNDSLFEVQLPDRRIRREKFGGQDTRGWFLSADNTPLVKLDFLRADSKLKLTSVVGDDEGVIFEDTTPTQDVWVIGVTPDGKQLVAESHGRGPLARGMWLIDVSSGDRTKVEVPEGFKGEFTRALTDRNKAVVGFQTSGAEPRTYLLDADANSRIRSIENMFLGSVVRLSSWSDDFSRLVVFVSGGQTSGAYLLFDSGSERPSMIGAQYPSVSREGIASTQLTTTKAEDGLEIPIFITYRNEVLNAGPAPVVVLLDDWHRSNDTGSFYWLAQYFAAQGYLVAEPRVRGSRGFGDALFSAGDGELGSGSISDIQQSLRFLENAGLARPGEACVIGFGLGAYAALSAASFGDVKLRCAAGLNGLYDLNNYMDVHVNAYGPFNTQNRYLQTLTGFDTGDRAELAAISPAQQIESIDAPIMLVHAEHDVRFRVKQARQMHTSLKRNKATVEYLEIERYPFWASRNEPRKKVTSSLGEFVRKHMPAK